MIADRFMDALDSLTFVHAWQGETADKIGGAEEDRTPDLRIANATLSQLSYGPTVFSGTR